VWTDAAKLEAAIRAPIGAHVLRADSQVIERPGWYQVVTPSSTYRWLNEVVLSAIEDADAERVVAETIARYRRLGVDFKWCVGPWSRPAHLAELLAPQASERWDVRGMTCDPTALHMESSVRAEQVTERSLDEHVDATMRLWAMPESEREPLRAASLARLRSGETELYVVRHDGSVAGTAGLLAKQDGSAYLVGAIVDEGARGRGFYKALLAARLARLRERGIRLATTQAREATSAPILARLGFDTVFRSQVFVFERGEGPELLR
jgi:N-acetylglutamate synthase-like GNAT family acetyltransferase